LLGENVVIGYQGELGSNAEAAAHTIAAELQLDDVEYRPLVSSRNVIMNLDGGKIDAGVVATKNNIGGTVAETFEAIKDEQLELMGTCVLEIHHCLFARPGITLADIDTVASHEQALAQTAASRARLVPGAEGRPVPDTAIAARWLAAGELDERTAVICKREAGEANGLELLAADIEDRPSLTEFRMFRPSDIDYDNEEPPSLGTRIQYLFVNQSGLGIFAKVLIVAGIMSSMIFAGSRLLDSIDVATSVSGALSAIFLFLTSDKVSQHMEFKSLCGYWKYYSLPDKGRESEVNLLYETPRIVEIQEADGELFIRGWLCDKTTVQFFESSKTLASSTERSRGSLVYWYRSPEEAGREVTLSGFVELSWVKRHPAAPVNRMSGRYSGSATRETGKITYLRISQREFDVHRKSVFLGNGA
jgi:prephenate dehydratase